MSQTQSKPSGSREKISQQIPTQLEFIECIMTRGVDYRLEWVEKDMNFELKYSNIHVGTYTNKLKSCAIKHFESDLILQESTGRNNCNVLAIKVDMLSDSNFWIQLGVILFLPIVSNSLLPYFKQELDFNVNVECLYHTVSNQRVAQQVPGLLTGYLVPVFRHFGCVL